MNPITIQKTAESSAHEKSSQKNGAKELEKKTLDRKLGLKENATDTGLKKPGRLSGDHHRTTTDNEKHLEPIKAKAKS